VLVDPVGWREATERALYGEDGFYLRDPGPAAHFRTSAHASPLFAAAVAALADSAGLRRVVDVGAGRGELLLALRALDDGLALVGVEVAGRPRDLPDDVTWLHELGGLPDLGSALLVANEWLDNVPVDVVVRTEEGTRLVRVDPETGEESLGGEPSQVDLDWLDRWWPLREVGDRAEIGRPRDEAWAQAIGSLPGGGVALAVDYHHVRAGRPPTGTLTAYRAGRLVPAVPDGSCDITSHVALDACSAAGTAAGATATVLTDQRHALSALLGEVERPRPDLARTAPADYLLGLSRGGELAELTETGGLGDFGWLLQSVGGRLPPPFMTGDREGSHRL
jgi:SAM-dependent MidA family methyltransferase